MRTALSLICPILAVAPILFAFDKAAIVSASLPATHPPSPQTEVVIAAAADLKFAMDTLVALFSAHNPAVLVKVVYGSSGNFFQQIDNGAPFDLFFSADINYPRQLKEKGKALSVVH